MIVGGNAQGLRMLAALCTGLASSGVQHGQVALNAGDLLLEGSEADMVIALRPDAEDDASKPAGAAECGPHALPATSVVRHLCNASNSEPALRRTKRPAFACPAG